MRPFFIYIFSLILFIGIYTSIFSQDESIEINEKEFFYPPQEFIIEKKENDIIYLKSNDEEVYSFIIKLESSTINQLLSQFISAILNATLIVPDELYLLQQKEYKITPKLNYVGCLENKFKHCFEILNFNYNIKDVLFELVLEQSKSTEELRNIFISFFKKIPSDLKSSSNITHLFYRIKIKIIEKDHNNLFLIVFIIPKSLYSKYQLYINELPYALNFVPGNIPTIQFEETFEQTKNENNFLFIVNDAYSMKQNHILLKKQLSHLITVLKTFNINSSLGLLTTNDCKLKTDFTNNIKNIEESIKLANKRHINSCVYYAEKIFNDPQCNDLTMPHHISIVCISNEPDQYEKLNINPFHYQKNIFTENKLPFYALIPLNYSGKFEICKNDKKHLRDSSLLNSINFWELAQNTNSSIFNICMDDYRIYLEQIAMDTAFKFSPIKLSRIPVPHTIEVWNGDNKIEPYTHKNNDLSKSIFYIFSESENSILFIGKPVEGRIKISYSTLEH